MTIRNCAFSHTEMSGLKVSDGSKIVVEKNVFTDIGYHGLLFTGKKQYENITIANNYINGAGISRQWSTFGIYVQGSLNVLITNNEVTGTSGGGIKTVGERFARGETRDMLLESD